MRCVRARAAPPADRYRTTDRKRALPRGGRVPPRFEHHDASDQGRIECVGPVAGRPHILHDAYVCGCLVSRVPDRIPSLNYVCPRRCLPISARRWQVPLTSKVPLAHSHSQRPRGRRRLSRLAGAEHRRSSSCPLAIAALHHRMPYLHLLPPDERVARLAAPNSLLLTRCSRWRRCCSPSARPSSPSSRDTCRWGHASPPAVGRGADQAARRAARARSARGSCARPLRRAPAHLSTNKVASCTQKAPAPPQTRTPARAPPHRIPSRSHAHRCLPRRRDDRVQKMSDQYEPRSLAQRDSRHCLSTKVLFCRSTS